MSFVRLFGICTCTNNPLLFLVRPGSASIDLSKATKIRGVVFRPESLSTEWIIATLQTITPKHRDFRHISIHLPSYSTTLFDAGTDVRKIAGEVVYGQWLDLDRLLVQFWESRSVRPTVIAMALKGGKQYMCRKNWVGCLLPEVTGREAVDLVES